MYTNEQQSQLKLSQINQYICVSVFMFVQQKLLRFYFCGAFWLLLNPIPVIWLQNPQHIKVHSMKSHCSRCILFPRIMRLKASNFAFNFIEVRLTVKLFFGGDEFIIYHIEVVFCVGALVFERNCVFMCLCALCIHCYYFRDHLMQSLYKIDHYEGSQRMINSGLFFSFIFFQIHSFYL